MSRPILSLDGLIDWLRTKDPNEYYRYTDTKGCLLFQYIKACGLPVHSVGDNYWRDIETRREHHFDRVLNDVAGADPHTFGGALERAINARVCEHV